MSEKIGNRCRIFIYLDTYNIHIIYVHKKTQKNFLNSKLNSSDEWAPGVGGECEQCAAVTTDSRRGFPVSNRRDPFPNNNQQHEDVQKKNYPKKMTEWND